MSLNDLVDFYNKKLNKSQSQSNIVSDASLNTGPSSFSGNNTGFESYSETVNSGINNFANVDFEQSGTSALLLGMDSYRFHMNDQALHGETIRSSNVPPRLERVKQADKIEFSSGDHDIDEYEHDEEYNKRYPDVKHQLSIISARQAKLPPVSLNINPGEQIQRLVQQGKLKNFHGYVNYPYNYIESPWHYDHVDEQQGFVNLNPPRAYLTQNELQYGFNEDLDQIELPYSIPQETVSQDRYELVPLPKMVYKHFVPLVATRRIVYRRPNLGHTNI